MRGDDEKNPEGKGKKDIEDSQEFVNPNERAEEWDLVFKPMPGWSPECTWGVSVRDRMSRNVRHRDGERWSGEPGV